jgi:Raf kinase inhibitor-like YbhB/YbcL family protein
MRRVEGFAGPAAVALLVLAGCSSSGSGGSPGSSGASSSSEASGSPAASPSKTLAPLRVSSPQWRDGGELAPPIACTNDTELGHSPALSWSKGPAGTTEYAITVTDPDANDFVHWAVLRLPVSTTSLPEGASPNGEMPSEAEQLDNGFAQSFYGGPCPPPGKPHHYVLTVWAVKGHPSGFADISPDAIASGSLTATYSR